MKLKSLAKEEEIFRVVLDITSTVGLAGLKMSDIAKRAGLAHGTVYIYFKNKKDLINQLFKKEKLRASKSMWIGRETDNNFHEALKGFWINYIIYLIDNQKETRFIRQCLESPFLEKSNLELSDNSKQKLVAFFEKGKEDHYLKSLDTELLMGVFSGLGKEVVYKINNGLLKRSDGLIADSFDLCWNAIRR